MGGLCCKMRRGSRAFTPSQRGFSRGGVGGAPGDCVSSRECGHAQAKRQVLAILQDFGWESVDIGALDGARLLEPLAMLWIRYARQNNHWTHAFKLLDKKSA